MDLQKIGLLGFFDAFNGMEVAQFAQKIERLGYSVLWVPEVMGREIFSLSSYVLSRTENLVVGAGVAIVYTYEPIAAANATRTLAELFEDRFILGLGVSNKGYNARRGIGYNKPVTFMRDYLAKMKASPYSSPAPRREAPIVLAGMMPKMLHLAATETKGTLTYFTTTEQVRRVREAIGPGSWLCAIQVVLLETDSTKARALARRYMQTYMAIDHYIHRLRGLGFNDEDFTNGGSDRLVDAIIAWGCEEHLRQPIDSQFRAGANHVCIVPLRSDRELGGQDRGIE